MPKYLFEPIDIHWTLSVEKIRHTADATASANGVAIKAQCDTQDMYSAIDMVMDKLEKQVRKHKEKVRDHKPHGAETVKEALGAQAPSQPARDRDCNEGEQVHKADIR